jgi:iron complex outermembrane receptor protein
MAKISSPTSRRACLPARTALLASVGGLAVLVGPQAFAQDSQAPTVEGTPLAPPGPMDQAAATDQTEAPDTTGPETAPTGGVEDIVVTARKRQESTQDVPLAIVAFSPERLAKYDLSNLERIAVQTPSFSIGRSPSGSGATLVLRGIGSNTTSIGLEQSVAVIVDGIYYGQGRTINEGLFDLARLEILKGPQALFFGKNATAGVVSLSTADPGDELEIIGRTGYEFTGQQVFGEAIVSSPLTETLGVRVAARASKMFDGYYDQIGSTRLYRTFDDIVAPIGANPTDRFSDAAGGGRAKEFFIRGTLKWEPTDRLSATLKANFGINENNNPGAGSVLYRCPTGFSALTPLGLVDNPIPCRRWFKSSANRFPADLAAIQPAANRDGALGNQYRSWAVTGNVNYKLTDDINITWSNNYQWNKNEFQFDGDSVSAPNVLLTGALQPPGRRGIFASERTTYRAYSSELRALTSFDSPLNVMIGGYIDDTHRDYDAWTAQQALENSAATPGFRRFLGNSKDSQTDGKTIALFGQAILKPIEEIEITGGARYTHEKKKSYFIQPYSHPLQVPNPNLPNQRVDSDLTFNDWSPEVTIKYQPTRDINVYAAYKTGYKSGGFSNSGILSGATFNAPTGSPVVARSTFEFTPETAESFEAGVKTTLFDRQLRFNVSAYTTKYSDLQLDFFRADVFAFTTINAGSARTKGIEVDFEIAPRALEGLTIRGSANYNKARYGNAISACWAGQTVAQGCNLVFVGPGETDVRTLAAGEVANRQNLKGRPTANAPRWTGSLGVNYDRDLGVTLKGGISVDARYSDDYLVSAFGNPNTRQNSYVSLDASVRVGTQDDRWQLALIGRNLTNRWYATGGTDAPGTGTGTGTAVGVPADQIGFATVPRTVQAQVTFRY